MTRILFFCGIIVSLNLRAGYQDNLFPSLDNWKVNIDKHTYEIIDLWGFLGQKAEIYNSFGFQSLHIAEYTNKQDNLVKVELYKFNSVNGAYGVYINERNPKYIDTSSGIEKMYVDGNMLFSAGEFLVKISDIGQQPAGIDKLKEICIQIIKAIAPENILPKAISLFPEKCKIPYSDKIIPENFLGYHFPGTAFTENYDSLSPCTLFIVETKSREEAADMLENFTGLYKENKVVKDGEYNLIDDFFNGKLIISQQSKFLFGASSYADKVQTIKKLELIRGKIENIPEVE